MKIILLGGKASGDELGRGEMIFFFFKEEA